MMRRLNIAGCELPVTQEQGRFRCRAEEVGPRLDGRLLGAAVYEMGSGETNWPYHVHYGVEEWLYVISGTPMLRDPSGERPVSPGTLIAFPTGPAGAHTVAGPGRVIIFSAGADGWASAHASLYPDSDKVSSGAGLFRRADALEAWAHDAPLPAPPPAPADQPCPSIDLTSADPGGLAGRLGSRTWEATLWDLAGGEATGPYHYSHRREQWALVISGTPTLRHTEGEDVLEPADLVALPDGPDGAHRLSNGGPQPARLLVISTPVDAPMSEVHPEDGTVIVRLSDREGFRFRLSDRIADYWDGEPGAY